MNATLREARDVAKLTQERLAELSGVDQTTISSLETFKHTNPTLQTVEKLARALGIAPSSLRFRRDAVDGDGHGAATGDCKGSTVSVIQGQGQ